MPTRAIAVALLVAAGCNHLPHWRGEVPPPSAVDDPCGSGKPTEAGSTRLHRRPYLQRVDAESAVIAWAGIPEGTPRVVVAGAREPERHVIAEFAAHHPGTPAYERERRAELYDELAEVRAAALEVEPDETDEESVEPDEFYILAAQLEGLESGKRYCYRIETDAGPLTDWASLTAAPPVSVERPLEFVVLGDTGSGSAAQVALARQIARLRIDAILFVGDLAYPEGTHQLLQERFFEVYGDILNRVPAFAAVGNHDDDSEEGRPFEEVFLMPRDRRWYSFDWGPVHFVVLDTTRINPAQAAWLERDLSRTAARGLTVVVSHHPPYSSGLRRTRRGWKDLIAPVIARHAVELVISGHDHHYERSGPVDGVTYIVTGGGGGRLTSARPNEQSARLVLAHHFLTLHVTGDEILVRAIGIDGQEIDRVRVRKR